MASPEAYAEVVHAFFNRAERLFPKWVSPRRATIISIVVGLLTTALLYPMLSSNAARVQDPSTLPKDQMTSAAVLLGSIVGVVYLSSAVRDYVFRVDMLSSNSLHFAMEYWIPRYLRAFRTKGFLAVV